MVDIAEPWGERTPYGRGEPWPARADAEVRGEAVDRWVASASVLHANGDGIDIAVRSGDGDADEVGAQPDQEAAPQALVVAR